MPNHAAKLYVKLNDKGKISWKIASVFEKLRFVPYGRVIFKLTLEFD